MVYIPFISGRSLGKRKGGGGGGKGGGGGGKTSSSGSGSSSSGSTSSGSGSSGSRGAPVSVGGSSKTTSIGGSVGGKVTTIPAGQPFAGRQMGGGTRSQVYGTPFYGSGYYYPVTGTGRYYAGRGFPFFFWPLVWGTTAGLGAGYLWVSLLEFGSPSNSSRPGGPEVQLRIDSPAPTSIYVLIADTDTANALITPLTTNCGSITNKPLSLLPFDGSGTQPKPEQTIQYYRDSSVALTMAGYNNTAVFTEDESVPAVALPSHDATFLACINNTIGAQVPLVDAGIVLQTRAFWMLCVTLLVAVRNAF